MKKISLTLQILVFLEISTAFAGGVSNVVGVAKDFNKTLKGMGGVDTKTIKAEVTAFQKTPEQKLAASKAKEQKYQEQLKSGDAKTKKKAEDGIANEQKTQKGLTKKIETQKAAAEAEKENAPPAKRPRVMPGALSQKNAQGALGGQRFSGGAPQRMTLPQGAVAKLGKRAFTS